MLRQEPGEHWLSRKLLGRIRIDFRKGRLLGSGGFWLLVSSLPNKTRAFLSFSPKSGSPKP